MDHFQRGRNVKHPPSEPKNRDYEDESANIPEEENFYEETAAEFAEPINTRRGAHEKTRQNEGQGFGYIALALAILSLFTAPFLFGVSAVVLGFIARARGARGIGTWAIAIGAITAIVRVFLAPFFLT